jgi:hypothetical protein
MTLARLLLAALLLCSLSAFAQDQQGQKYRPSISPCRGIWNGCPAPGNIRKFNLFFFDSGRLNSAAASEPWRIFPDSQNSPVSGQTFPDQIPAHQLKLEVRVRQLLESQIDRLSEEGPTCYAIRSYVVARDSKDSDSTHPAGYSTCQPAARYGLKATEIRSATADR